MRNRFDRQLEQLNTELIEMGAMCERAIEGAVQAVLKADIDQAKETIQLDHEIDQQEHDIEGLCLKLLMQQQPEYWKANKDHYTASLKDILFSVTVNSTINRGGTTVS